jgi:hypothetical protein
MVTAISYRDPSGFIFKKEGIVYRQVNKIFREQFEYFISSGCYEKLVKTGLLLPHETIPDNLTGDPKCWATLKPERIPFISYPYEWNFDRLKDAALLTLKLVRESLEFGMILKDAAPHNIQWLQGRLIFIDTLSFERYNEQEPWIAYRQFCENFLGPLQLMHYRKQPLQELMLAWPEGIPLTTISSLLPGKTKLSLHSYLHIHLHASIGQKKRSGKEKKIIFSKKKLLDLISSLESLVSKMILPDQKSVWSDYYEEASKRNDYLEQKKKIISNWLDQMENVENALDLGANEGEFSALLSDRNIQTLAVDFDPYCINRLYRKIRSGAERNIQPLVIDLSNPSPALGVNNEERTSFIERAPADLILALALIHHLAIGKNISFELIAALFQRLGKQVIVEFIPKQDEKVQLLLSQKKDIYPDYDESNFESAFQKYFSITKKEKIPGSERILYFMQKV